MDDKNIKSKISVIDNNGEQQDIPVYLGIQTSMMLVEDAIKSGLKVIIEPVI